MTSRRDKFLKCWYQ